MKKTDAHAESAYAMTGHAGDLPTYPLSFSQEAYWVFARLDPKSPFYIAHMSIELQGPLDTGQLKDALDNMTRNIAILRTCFPLREDGPVQLVLDEFQPPLAIVNMPSESEAAGTEIIASDAARPFDQLQNEPPVRFQLLRFNARRHILLAAFHHMICDGISLGNFARRLGASYAGHKTDVDLIQYSDYAEWQRHVISGATLENGLAFWRKELADAPARTKLPFDHLHAEQTFRGEIMRHELPSRLRVLLDETSTSTGATPFMILLAVLGRVLARGSGESDLVIGTVATGRERPEFREALGDFTNFLPVRLRMDPASNFHDLLEHTRARVLAAFEHRHVPFSAVVDHLRIERNSAHNPIYNVALLLQELDKTPALDFGPDIIARADYKTRDLARTAVLDLRFEVVMSGRDIRLDCEYAADLFEPETIANLLRDFENRLSEALGYTEKLEAETPARAIIIASTFTAELLEAPLQYWFQRLELPHAVRFAEYNQVFQYLLNRGEKEEDPGYILLRFEDWLKDHAVRVEQVLGSCIRDLVRAFTTARRRGAGELICVLCPSSPEYEARYRSEFNAAEKELEHALSEAGIPFLGETSRHLPDDYYDQETDRLGHIPFNAPAFAGIATIIARRTRSLRGKRHKVIALDCDETLWRGIVGENGPRGVRLEPEHRALREFMLARQAEGMLLVLCSKNNEKDALEVFQTHPHWPLTLDDVVAHRINWRPKHENLTELAAQLNLGLDTFIFVDDSPLECALMREQLPEVHTLELSPEPGQWAAQLRGTWEFDPARVTSEDRNRTRAYRGEISRKKLESETLSHEEFLAKLDLRIKFAALDGENAARAAQLTQRTNQFNCNTARRDEAELKRLAAEDAWLVDVSDRFGDYGLVGLMISRPAAASLRVETFLLSCRALGRRVEHAMLNRLREIAAGRGLRFIDIEFLPSEKNAPARTFLAEVGEAHGLSLYRIPVEEAPESEPAAAGSANPESAEEIAEAVEAYRVQKNTDVETAGDVTTPENELEARLLELWRRVLALPNLSLDDNFFKVGGNSLAATRLAATREFHVSLNLRDFIEHPTVRRMAALLLERQTKCIPPEQLNALIYDVASLEPDALLRALASESEFYKVGHES